MSERIIYGINTVRQILNNSSGRLLRVYLQKGMGAERLGRLSEELSNQSVVVEKLSSAELESLTGTSKHQGVAAAVIHSAPMDDGAALDYLADIANPLILVLDSIEDPRNYGACLRTAEGLALIWWLAGGAGGSILRLW